MSKPDKHCFVYRSDPGFAKDPETGRYLERPAPNPAKESLRRGKIRRACEVIEEARELGEELGEVWDEI